MSFSRAPIKRFNERKCNVPSPTRYYPYEKKSTAALPSIRNQETTYPWRAPIRARAPVLKKNAIPRTISTPDIRKVLNIMRRSTSTPELGDSVLNNTSLYLACQNCNCNCHGSENSNSNLVQGD
ncbi:unnamed protein product [Orchesella dallaii]|uniref:Uncharacterized protein n=1 Tax=Orchesella dallaii TaxID=48710 RepID=A0ABP1R5W2_9HEXA